MKEKRLYDSVRWRKARDRFLDSHPLCALCWVIDRDTPATIVDHIKPHGGDPDLFWDENNWQPLCASCHSGKKRLQENRGHSAAAGLDGTPLDAMHPWNRGRGG
jgi:5-methylcytosine-specific restriction endonuclease McrA